MKETKYLNIINIFLCIFIILISIRNLIFGNSIGFEQIRSGNIVCQALSTIVMFNVFMDYYFYKKIKPVGIVFFLFAFATGTFTLLTYFNHY